MWPGELLRLSRGLWCSDSPWRADHARLRLGWHRDGPAGKSTVGEQHVWQGVPAQGRTCVLEGSSGCLQGKPVYECLRVTLPSAGCTLQTLGTGGWGTSESQVCPQHPEKGAQSRCVATGGPRLWAAFRGAEEGQGDGSHARQVTHMVAATGPEDTHAAPTVS